MENSNNFYDKQEEELVESFERGEWHSAENADFHIETAREAAKNTLTKSEKINIRLTKNDLIGLKRQAAKEGLPYQTLISSIIHKYITNQFKDAG